MRELLGVEPGSVTPFGVINDKESRVNVVLDRDMMKNDILNYHPLVNTMTTSIASADLVKFLQATGHDPRIEALSADARGPNCNRPLDSHLMDRISEHSRAKWIPVRRRGNAINQRNQVRKEQEDA